MILHLAAILVYKFGKKVNLTLAMVSGRASSEPPARIKGPDGGISQARMWLGLALMAGLQIATHALPLLRPGLVLSPTSS